MGKSNRRQHDGSSTRQPFSYAPRNPKQKDFLRTIQDNDIAFGVGSAGSGKTFLAAQVAMDGLESGRYTRIVVCRPLATAGNERIGYLPGDINDKLDPYLRPVFDAFATRWTPRTIALFRNEGTIEVVPFGFMRGRTFRDAFVLADEAQNTTPDQMFMLLTRLGEGSKMVLTGDPDQADIPVRTLELARERLRGISRIGWTEFATGDVVRHPVVESVIRAWKDDPKSLKRAA